MVSFNGTIALTTVDNCDFYGISLSNYTGAEYCLTLFNCLNLQFFNCSFNTIGNGTCVSVDGSYDLYFDNCNFQAYGKAIKVSDSSTLFKWIMFENCIFYIDTFSRIPHRPVAVDASNATNTNEIITFANCYYNDMVLVTKEHATTAGARINVALYEITSLSTEEVSEIADDVFGN
jgi:hypothetical protein